MRIRSVSCLRGICFALAILGVSFAGKNDSSADMTAEHTERKMKLIFAIVNNDDSHAVSSSLAAQGILTTKLASTGGFLMAGNTTFLICSEDENVDKIIGIVKENAHRRKQCVPASAGFGTGAPEQLPIEIPIGGATIFVTDVERFEKA